MHSFGKVFGDLFDVQAECGLRVNELIGLPFVWFSDSAPDYLSRAFDKIGMQISGSIYLESQPANPHLKIVDGSLPRKPLKWRKEISVACARTVPIFSTQIWNMLNARYEKQKALFLKLEIGDDPLAYLLFEGVQVAEYLAVLRKAYFQLGIKPKGSHILRHSCATLWASQGISQKVAEITLGHKQASHEKYVRIVAQVNQKSKYNGILKSFESK